MARPKPGLGQGRLGVEAPLAADMPVARALGCARCDGPLRPGQCVCSLCQLAARIAVVEARGQLVGPHEIEAVRRRLLPRGD